MAQLSILSCCFGFSAYLKLLKLLTLDCGIPPRSSVPWPESPHPHPLKTCYVLLRDKEIRQWRMLFIECLPVGLTLTFPLEKFLHIHRTAVTWHGTGKDQCWRDIIHLLWLSRLMCYANRSSVTQAFLKLISTAISSKHAKPSFFMFRCKARWFCWFHDLWDCDVIAPENIWSARQHPLHVLRPFCLCPPLFLLQW